MPRDYKKNCPCPHHPFGCFGHPNTCECANKEIDYDEAELKRLREFVGWIDSWVSNPVGSYSVSALDGLFGITRDRIAALSPSQRDTA